MTTKVSWIFSCGHTLYQFKPIHHQGCCPPSREVIDICPECKEDESDVKQKEEQATQQKKEAINLYRQQATTMKQHLINAAKNSEVRAEFEKMLENCQVLWATKIKEFEKTNMHPPRTRVSNMFDNDLKDMKEKSELMLVFEQILCRREEGRHNKYSGQAKKLQKRCDEWRMISAKIAELAEIYEKTIAKKFDDFEGDISKVWLDALRLIKDE